MYFWKNKHYLGIAFLVILLFLVPELVDAQCPMCRIAAESNLKNGGSSGKGLNRGIFYLLAMPYILIGTIGYLWWRGQKKQKKMDHSIREEKV